MLARYKVEWDAGRFDRLIPAFMVCGWNDVPVPAWLRDAILDELHFSYTHRKRGDRHARTGAIQDHSRSVHQTRHALVQLGLRTQQIEVDNGTRQRVSARDAAQEAELVLRRSEHPARGSIDAILESYNLLENKQD